MSGASVGAGTSVAAAVSVVGAAWRTPLGNTLDEVTRRMRAGEASAISNPFSSTYKLQRVAPIRTAPARSRNERFLRRMGLYGMEVAREAFTAAGIPAGPRYGFFTGVGGLRAHWDDMMSALADQDDSGKDAWERGLKNVHPYWMLRHLSNNVHALASAELGLRGEGATFGGADAGQHAMRSAVRSLSDGAIDCALVVAYDSLLEPETLVELGERMPATFVPGEAAAAIVLRAGAEHPVRPLTASGVDRATAGTGALPPLRAASVDRVTALMGHIGAATAVVQAIADLALADGDHA
jgi:3-oxoacyl-(acyl-carrier-protein) synthase